MKNSLLLLAVSAASITSASAALFISEVDSNGSSAAYAGDWFELTNTGPAAIDITGWKVDDSSNLFSSALLLTGVTSIAAGQSVVFLEGTLATQTAFITAWFSGTAPAGFTIGNYSGSGIGLSSGGDAVNIFNAAGVAQAGVTFGAVTLGATLDNAAGLNSAAISTLSVVGNNGAFNAPSPSTEAGSPGVIPEPSALACLLGGFGLLSLRRRRSA